MTFPTNYGLYQIPDDPRSTLEMSYFLKENSDGSLVINP